MHLSIDIQDSYYDKLMAFIKTLPQNVIHITNEDEEMQAYLRSEQFQNDRARLHQNANAYQNGTLETTSHHEMWQRIEKRAQER